jgi:hypothetical protein
VTDNQMFQKLIFGAKTLTKQRHHLNQPGWSNLQHQKPCVTTFESAKQKGFFFVHQPIKLLFFYCYPL